MPTSLDLPHAAFRKELDQARTRILAALCVLLVTAGLLLLSSEASAVPGMTPASAYLAFSAAWWLFVARRPGWLPADGRRHLALFADHGFNAWMCFAVGELYGLFFWGPVFATLGYGLRFGNRYALRSISAALLFQSMAMIANPYWSTHPYMAIGVLACNSILPAYALKLAAAMRARERAAEQRARQFELFSRVDHLTGVFNRHGFLLHLDAVLASGASGCLMFIDLDDFKNVNDQRGHDAGDRLLIEVAAALRAAVRSTDVVGRLGGDEFAVLVEGEDSAHSEEVARQIIERVGLIQLGPADPAGIGASVGVVTWNSDNPIDGERLLKSSDRAMYEAKRQGKNRVCFA